MHGTNVESMCSQHISLNSYSASWPMLYKSILLCWTDYLYFCSSTFLYHLDNSRYLLSQLPQYIIMEQRCYFQYLQRTWTFSVRIDILAKCSSTRKLLWFYWYQQASFCSAHGPIFNSLWANILNRLKKHLDLISNFMNTQTYNLWLVWIFLFEFLRRPH